MLRKTHVKNIIWHLRAEGFLLATLLEVDEVNILFDKGEGEADGEREREKEGGLYYRFTAQRPWKSPKFQKPGSLWLSVDIPHMWQGPKNLAPQDVQ